jgi:hypothetical protein
MWHHAVVPNCTLHATALHRDTLLTVLIELYLSLRTATLHQCTAPLSAPLYCSIVLLHCTAQVDGSHPQGQVDPAHYKWLKLELAKKALAAEATAKTVTDLLAERQQLQGKVHKLEVRAWSTDCFFYQQQVEFWINAASLQHICTTRMCKHGSHLLPVQHSHPQGCCRKNKGICG